MNYFASLGIFMRQGRGRRGNKITAREETEQSYRKYFVDCYKIYLLDFLGELISTTS